MTSSCQTPGATIHNSSRELDQEVVDENALVVAKILSTRRVTRTQEVSADPYCEEPGYEQGKFDVTSLYLLRGDTLKHLIERERRLKRRALVETSLQPSSHGQVMRSINHGKLKIGTSVVYDFTHTAR